MEKRKSVDELAAVKGSGITEQEAWQGFLEPLPAEYVAMVRYLRDLEFDGGIRMLSGICRVPYNTSFVVDGRVSLLGNVSFEATVICEVSRVTVDEWEVYVHDAESHMTLRVRIAAAHLCDGLRAMVGDGLCDKMADVLAKSGLATATE